MNAPVHVGLAAPPALWRIALSALAGSEGAAGSAEAAWLDTQALQTQWHTFARWLQAPPPEDYRLHALAAELALAPAETVAVALAAAVEFDPMLARVLCWLQAPAGGSRPTLGLLAAVAQAWGQPQALAQVAGGAARGCGLLQLADDARPLPERALQVPLPLVLALAGEPGAAAPWPGLRRLVLDPALAPPSLRAAAARQAQTLRCAPPGRAALVVRSGHPQESAAGAALVAAELGLQAVAVDVDWPPGLGPWLWLQRALPVWPCEIGPGELRRLPALPGWRGPLLVAAGVDGAYERDGDLLPAWRVPLPEREERAALWAPHVGADAAQALARTRRHSAAQVRQLARAAQRQATLAGAARCGVEHVDDAARDGALGDLGALAQRLPEPVHDDALVLPPSLREQLLALVQRCRLREGLADALGPSARTRYRPGVRALLVGPSGTGKTLAVSWLATSLGLPLYRVDLAAVASKYIGETEKNLAQLFARAEHADVVLLFDEADSLFGKRTDVKDANDRYANQQTNYLLQRIESLDGIALLTSNSRARFDSAFTRRLDAIVDFAAPGPEERRALWLAHLGPQHALSGGELNRIAAACDLAGGHIRNATLAAASRCGGGGGAIDYAALCEGVASEYRKLGRQLPAGL